MWEQIWTKIIEEFPKALFALVIPLGQFLWKRYKEGGGESRKRLLRLKIADLNNQRDSLARVSGVPNADRVLRDLDLELQAIFHSLFYLTLAAVLLGLLGVLAAWDGSESPYALLGFAMFLLVAFGFRWIALRLSRGQAPSVVAGERRPLKWRGFPTLVFWLALLIIPFLWLNAAEDEEALWAIPATIFMLLFAISALGWARSSEEPREPLGKLRSALLLFVPARPAGWVGELAWYADWAGLLGRKFTQASRPVVHTN